MRKIVCVTLVLCMFISAFAETFTVRTMFRTAEITIEDEWFQVSSYVYNHDFMRAMLEISMTGWGTSDNYGLEGDFGRESPSRAAAEDLKLNDFRAYNYDKSLNDASSYSAYYIGWRALEDGSCLIMCVARCQDYGCGFANNFDLGNGSVHKGFFSAGKEMAESVRDYAETVLEGKDIRIALTGYSRAAAVANIAGKLLDDMAAEGSISCRPQDIYTCAFAVPATVKNGMDGEGDALYDNIFSIINYLDIVPEVPLSVWDYTRYGKTLVFARGEAPDAAADMFRELGGNELVTEGKREKTEKTLASMANQIPSTCEYELRWERLFTAYLSTIYGKVSRDSIKPELIDRIRQDYSGTIWGKYVLDVYDSIGDNWVSDPVLAVLMFEGERGLEAIKSSAPAAALSRGTGDSMYSSLLSYLACADISADETVKKNGGSKLLLNAKYLPMLSTFAGFMECFEGHDFRYYMAYLLSLDEAEAFS